MQEEKRQHREQKTQLQRVIYEHGKIPPQAVDIEEAVLGALMVEKEAMSRVADKLSEEVFYKEQHQKVYRAIEQLFNAGTNIDILTVTNQLKNLGLLEIAGGAYYLTQLTNRVASSANLESHAYIILQKHLQRELIRLSSTAIKDGFEDTTDVFELYDKTISELINLVDFRGGSIDNITSIVKQNIEEMKLYEKDKRSVIGVDTGYSMFNQHTMGFQKKEMYVIAARPSMGKTAFMLSLANNIAIKNKVPVGVFSLEMGKEQLGYRIQTMRTGIPYDKLKSGSMSEADWVKQDSALQVINNSPMYVDDTASLSITSLRAKATKMVQQFNVEIIFVDYLQLMASESKRSNREQEISEISRGLKMIAKALNITVVALSQLSRSVEQRGGTRRPRLSDLRESGAIEQDADTVMFIYRPSVYKLEREDGEAFSEDYSEIIIEKNRNGPLSNMEFVWVPKRMQFLETEEEEDLTDDIPF